MAVRFFVQERSQCENFARLGRFAIHLFKSWRLRRHTELEEWGGVGLISQPNRPPNPYPPHAQIFFPQIGWFSHKGVPRD